MKNKFTLLCLLSFLMLQAMAQLRGTCTPTADTISPVVCSSYTSPSGHYTWTISDVYMDTIPNAGGCDSVLTINLTLVGPLSSFTTITICGGTTYDFNGQPISAPGLYTDTVSGTGGCDSIVTVNLQTNDINNGASVNGMVCMATQNNAGYQWLDCNTGSVITGAQNRTFTGVLNGSYRCIIYKGPCTDTTECVTILPSGIEEAEAVHFALYPNPGSGSFTITHNYSGIAQLSILNTLGETVKEFTLSASTGYFTVTDLPAGVYQVMISNRNEMLEVIKLVKQ